MGMLGIRLLPLGSCSAFILLSVLRNGAELLEYPVKSEFCLEVQQSDLSGW